MKHLKKYNEVKENLISEIEELFIPIKQDHYLNIVVDEKNFNLINFTKPIMYISSSKYHPNMNVVEKYILTHGISIFISKVIASEVRNIQEHTFNAENFADDLKFIINYIEGEKGLKFTHIYAFCDANFDSPNNRYYQTLEDFLSDNLSNNLLIMNIYFT